MFFFLFYIEDQSIVFLSRLGVDGEGSVGAGGRVMAAPLRKNDFRAKPVYSRANFL